MDRDVVLSHVTSMEEDCTLEIVIPEHVGPLKRHLESYAYRIRKNGREVDKKISTSVRLMDDGMTLALAVREPGKVHWNYCSKEDLKRTEEQLRKENELL